MKSSKTDKGGKVEAKRTGRKPKEKRIVEGVRFCERYSTASLSRGSEQDSMGRLFVGAELHDLTKVQICLASVDTVRQLYTGTLCQERLASLQAALEAKEEFYDFVSDFDKKHPQRWHLAKCSKVSGYRYKLQDNARGVVILLGSYYAQSDKPGSHLKIELSPHFLSRYPVESCQNQLDRLASRFFVDGDFEASGVACHLAVDVQGWQPDSGFLERFKTKARAVRSYDGITKLEFDELSTVAVRYGKASAETYQFGKHVGLQTAVYNKTLEVTAHDKIDYFKHEWEVYTLGQFDPEKPVWRVEFRFHHNVINQIAEGIGKLLKRFLDLEPHLTDMLHYALLKNRLDETKGGTYIDPFWQLLYDDVTVYHIPGGKVRIVRGYKKTPASAVKNYGQIIGNIVSVCARRGYDTRQVMLQLKHLDFYEDLVKLYKENGKGGEPGLREAVEKALCLRRLIGKAAA